MDEETKQVMSLPRCGVKDKVGTGSHARRRRYALQGKNFFTPIIFINIQVAVIKS